MPLRWRKPRTIFVNSMSDLFHEGIPTSSSSEVFDDDAGGPLAHVPGAHETRGAARGARARLPWAPNIWMGVTIENRRFVHRADVCAGASGGAVHLAPSRCWDRLKGSDLTGSTG